MDAGFFKAGDINWNLESVCSSCRFLDPTMVFCCHFGLLIAFLRTDCSKNSTSEGLLIYIQALVHPEIVGCCCFEVLLLDWREVKRFCFPLAAFYWMDSSVSCWLFCCLFFYWTEQPPPGSLTCRFFTWNVDYQHIFSSLSEPGCNILNPWQCGEPFSKNPFDALILINVFVQILGQNLPDLILFRQTCRGSDGLSGLSALVPLLYNKQLSLSEFFLYCRRCVLLCDLCLTHVSIVHTGNLGGSSNLQELKAFAAQTHFCRRIKLSKTWSATEFMHTKLTRD